MATDTLVGEGRVWEWPSPKGLSNHIGTLTFGTQKINCPSNYFYISESQESAWCYVLFTYRAARLPFFLNTVEY